MKHTLSIALCCASMFATAFAFAQQPGYTGQTANAPQAAVGYTGPSAAPTTVKAALSMLDDTPVILRGKITKNLGNERYLFSDSTGTIQVEIDQKVFYRSNVQISGNDLVEISGEVDKEWNKTEIDVKWIKKL